MAGHSQFKNIMYRKGAQDAKRAKLFTKLIRELTVAAKVNPDPEANPRLRSAITAARTANMPKDTMERAIKKGAGNEDGADYQEVRYEGYGPGGVAIIVEALTDNRNRTAAEIRSIFNKQGGNMGETNSVSFQFDQLGALTFSPQGSGKTLNPEALFEAAIEAGAQDMESHDDSFEVYTAPDDLHQVLDTLTKTSGAPEKARLIWKPNVTVNINEEQFVTTLKLLNALEDNDDVQMVFSNFEVDPALMEKYLNDGS